MPRIKALKPSPENPPQPPPLPETTVPHVYEQKGIEHSRRGTPQTVFEAIEEAAKSGNWTAAKIWMEREERNGVEGSNFKAATETLEAMREQGRLDLVDGALIMALLSLAKAVDTKPANANLWRQYLECLRILKSSNTEADAEDAGAAVLARLGAQVRDAEEPEPENPRRRGGGGGKGTRSTVHAVAGGSRRRRDGAAG